MSRALAARITKLEARSRAEGYGREIGVFAGKPVFKTEERDGVVYCFPLHSDDEYFELCRLQQDRLFEELAEYAAQLDEGEQDGRGTGPHSVGTHELPPLPPGKKRPQYMLTTDRQGVEWQIEIATGDRWRT